ncbi:MAG: GxxExxY protein [Candidatus Kapaibacterium sp.]
MPIDEKLLPDSEITRKIIGCAMTVHSTLGNGFQELIYQRALELELIAAGIVHSREYEMPIFYREKQIGTRRVDFLVEGKISVELKAIITLEPVHLAQAKNYLEAYNLETGLLINFGSKSLEFRRLTNQKYISQKTFSSSPKSPQIMVQTHG